MTYIGSVTEADKSMSDERRMEQERIQGFCSDHAGVNLPWHSANYQNQVNLALAPYLVVPREAQKTEADLLRELLAAANAKITALTATEPAPVPNPMARAVSRWPGSQGFIQGIRWRGSL